MSVFVNEQVSLFKSKVDHSRLLLVSELESSLNDIKSRIPKKILNMTLRELLLSTEPVIIEEPAIPVHIGKGKENIENVPLNEVQLPDPMTPFDKNRRVTRSMAAKQRQSLLSSNRDSTILSTPKFHPGLPETPAIIRKGRQRDSQSKKSLVRVARTTIKSSSIGIKSTEQQVKETPKLQRKRKMEDDNISGIVSMEMSNGQVLDVDITESPSRFVANLSQDAVRDMKKKMQAYATQLKSFFKKLKLHE